MSRTTNILLAGIFLGPAGAAIVGAYYAGPALLYGGVAAYAGVKAYSEADERTRLLARWEELRGRCRGQVLERAASDCADMAPTERRLYELGMCYGDPYQPNAQRRWRYCSEIKNDLEAVANAIRPGVNGDVSGVVATITVADAGDGRSRPVSVSVSGGTVAGQRAAVAAISNPRCGSYGVSADDWMYVTVPVE